MTFDLDFGYSFPLFSSLLKKRGKKKRRMNDKNRDQKSYLSARYLLWYEQINDFTAVWLYIFFINLLKLILHLFYLSDFLNKTCNKGFKWYIYNLGMIYRTNYLHIYIYSFNVWFKKESMDLRTFYTSFYLFLSMYIQYIKKSIHIIKNSVRYLPLLELKSMNIGCFNPGPPILRIK